MPDVLSTADTTVSAGAFNRPIKIQKPSIVNPDAMGGGKRTFVDYIKTMAHIGPFRGIEKIIGHQTHSSTTTKFLMRFRPSENIDASMQIVYRTRIYNIRKIYQLEEARTTILIEAEEQQSKGSV